MKNHNDKKKNEKIKIPTIVHFEIPADDVERARKFYTTLFGWKIEKIEVKKDGDKMNYWMISTSSKENRNEKPSLDGGLIKRQHPQQPNLNYVSVSSIDEYSNKVNELGGKIVLPKTEITDYGFFAVCIDTENNAFALWESKK
jgi:predicted enzyme related to lactoylglutathione lyase